MELHSMYPWSKTIREGKTGPLHGAPPSCMVGRPAARLKDIVIFLMFKQLFCLSYLDTERQLQHQSNGQRHQWSGEPLVRPVTRDHAVFL